MKQETKRFIITFAREVIENFVRHRKVIDLPKVYPKELDSKAGVFVSLHKQAELRGCVGVLYPTGKLVENLREAAVNSTLDSRFEALDQTELDEISVEISILDQPTKVNVKLTEFLNHIEPNKDGVIIKSRGKSALFLPQVWALIPDKQEFLSHLCLKAGLHPLEWKNKNINLSKFQVEIIKEVE